LTTGIGIRFHFGMQERIGRRVALALVAVVLLTLASACSLGHAAQSSGGPLTVVAAENFYGDIAKQIAGGRAEVVSIISDPTADPHLFEPSITDGARVAAAQVVIENGAGYDQWMDRLTSAEPNPSRQTVRVAQVLDQVGTDVNPHFWYDTPQLPTIAAAIETAMATADPGNAAYYQQQETKFEVSLKPLSDVVDQIKASYAHESVAYTEPLPQYLLQAAGLAIKTPLDFARAIEEGVDPTPQAAAEMNALISGKEVKVLLYNSQATSPIVDQLRSLAQDNSIPVVSLTETMPTGASSFQSWQLSQAQALLEALGG
jgi:zinc/manganese transport system substrate-binding protein